jgi:hypothetical protein
MSNLAYFFAVQFARSVSRLTAWLSVLPHKLGRHTSWCTGPSGKCIMLDNK